MKTREIFKTLKNDKIAQKDNMKQARWENFFYFIKSRVKY